MGSDYALSKQETGILFKDSQADPHLLQFSGSDSAIVHNPYPCLGRPSNVWPRGLPLEAIHDSKSYACEVTTDVNITEAFDGRCKHHRVLGVVQTLANHEPDVDAIYRRTSPEDDEPYSLSDEPTLASPSQLMIVPDSAFTPYNAQVRGDVYFYSLLYKYRHILIIATVHTLMGLCCGELHRIARAY